MIVLQAERVPLLAKFGGDGGGKFFRGLASGLGGSLYFLSVLVGSSSQHHVEALHALEALDRVGGDGGIRMADVRRGVDVVDRSGQVVFHRLFFRYAKLASAMMSLSAMPVERASARQSSYSGAKDFSETLTRTLPCGVSTSTQRRAATMRSAV